MSKFLSKITSPITSEAMSGVLLGVATFCALLARNMFWGDLYVEWLNMPVFSINWIGGAHHFHVIDIINEILMVCFFVLISIEIKKEFLIGVFQDVRYALLPCAAAIGGIIVPSVLFLLLGGNDEVLRNGWAIPTATDIAFSLGILSLLGNRVPASLRIFLTTLAIVDDLFAVLIIAVFYANALAWLWLGAALVLIGALYALNRMNVQAFSLYLLIGVALWWVVLQSGVHVTIAGVIWAAFLPLKSSNNAKPALLYRTESYLRPFVDYFVLPAFAFANAGVPLSSMSLNSIMHPLFLGVFLGLVIGKPLGILLGSGLVLVTGMVPFPIGMEKRHLFSVACLGGVGFTMSLLIAVLAFAEGELLLLTRQAILLGSLLSAALALLTFPKTQARLFFDQR